MSIFNNITFADGTNTVTVYQKKYDVDLIAAVNVIPMPKTGTGIADPQNDTNIIDISRVTKMFTITGVVKEETGNSAFTQVSDLETMTYGKKVTFTDLDGTTTYIGSISKLHYDFIFQDAEPASGGSVEVDLPIFNVILTFWVGNIRTA